MEKKDIKAEVKRKIGKPVEVVFEALTDPAKMTNYFISEASGPIAEGKTLTWIFGDAGVSVDILVQKVNKNKEIAFTWPATGKGTSVTLKLEPVTAQETLVTATETGWNLDAEGVKQALEQTQGWTDMLLCLKAYLEFDINLRRSLKLSTLC